MILNNYIDKSRYLETVGTLLNVTTVTLTPPECNTWLWHESKNRGVAVDIPNFKLIFADECNHIQPCVIHIWKDENL